MNKPINRGGTGEIVTLEQACERTSLGLSTVRQKAKECGAVLKIGRSFRIRIDVLLDYLYSFEL